MSFEEVLPEAQEVGGETHEAADSDALPRYPDPNEIDGKKETKPDEPFIIEESQLMEISDDKGHFRKIPPTDISSYPKRSEVFKRLAALEDDFSKRSGFESGTLEEGEYYYFVSNAYISDLCTWLQQDDDEETKIPIPIKNDTLFEKNHLTKVKKNGLESYSKTVKEETWQQLIKWFGGGPELRLKSIKGSQIVMGKLVRVVKHHENSSFRRFYFSPDETVENAKKEICEAFEVDFENSRLHDFFKNKPYNQLDTEEDLQKPLKKKQILHDNLLFLELPDEKGEYKITHRAKGPSYASGGNYYAGGNYLGGYGFGVAEDTLRGEKTTPGKLGLSNLGNTCYMNSTLQSLSNIPLLKEAFLSKEYEADINETNVLGYEGKVAKAFYNLMDKMWSGNGDCLRPAAFRKAITKAKQDFNNFQQHDSQEFLSQLLDAIHEDLNRVLEKPATERVEQNGRPDEVVAKESYDVYKMRNDSIIVDLFTGFFKSTVTCPIETCGNVSVTFDPYRLIPLPLQAGERAYQVLEVVYVPRSPRDMPRKIELIVPKSGPFYLLRELLKEELGINARNAKEQAMLDSGKLPEKSKDKDKLIALGYDESEKEVLGRRDLAIFSMSFNKLKGPYQDTLSLSYLGVLKDIICFETFDYAKFESFLTAPGDSDWKRKLEHPRPETERLGRMHDDEDADTFNYGEDNRGVEDEFADNGSDRDRPYRYGRDNDAEEERSGGFDGSEEKQEEDPIPAESEEEEEEEEDEKDAAEVVDEKGEKSSAQGDETKSAIGAEDKEDVENIEDVPFEVRYRLAESEREMIGEGNCPFIKGDLWGGNYNYNEDEQALRLEVFQVQKYDWAAYSNYQQEIKSRYGDHIDTSLTEEEFNKRQVFYLTVIGDTKEREVRGYARGYHSAFEMKGVYITAPNQIKEDKVKDARKSAKKSDNVKKDQVKDSEKSQGSSEAEKKSSRRADKKKNKKDKKKTPAKKKGTKKKTGGLFKRNNSKKKTAKKNAKAQKKGTQSATPESKPTDKKPAKKAVPKLEIIEEKVEEVVESIQKRAGKLKPGDLESTIIHGFFVLRPTQNRKKIPAGGGRGYYGQQRYYSAYQQEDESREAIILNGTISADFRFMWGRYQVDNSFTKGEFCAQRYESMNWDLKELKSDSPEETKVIMSKTKYPYGVQSENRLLVQVCHKVEEGLYSCQGIPESFFVPLSTTESDMVQALKTRFKIYMEKEFELTGESRTNTDAETGKEYDMIERFLKNVKVVRADSKFGVRQARYRRDELNVGIELDAQSDNPLRLTNHVYVWLVCQWTEYPFIHSRPQSIFLKKKAQEKMTLKKALELFQQTDKLNAMNAWYCNKCKEHREAYKQLQLWSVPKVLVIQFKRFSQEEGRIRADKLDIPVDFPFEMDLRDSVLEGKVWEEKAGKSVEADIEKTNNLIKDFQYELVAVSSHVGGGLGSGHYIASARNEIDGKWYEFNDSSVSLINEENKGRIVNPEAYVLFYVRKSELEKRAVILEERRVAAEAAAAEAAATATETPAPNDATEGTGDPAEAAVVVAEADADPSAPVAHVVDEGNNEDTPAGPSSSGEEVVDVS